MAKLTYIERRQLEALLGMGNGFVLDFTNATFAEFVYEYTHRKIYDDRYLGEGKTGSKANRLRTFWEQEPPHLVASLLDGFLAYISTLYTGEMPATEDLAACCEIRDRLKNEEGTSEIDEIANVGVGDDMGRLARMVQDSIERGEPELGLDRLHTFTTRLLRQICTACGIQVMREKPLHSLMGEYVKHVRKSGEIDSRMTELILKSSISILEEFNTVRNEHTYAHDNPLLSYEEAKLISKHVISAITFIKSLEDKRTENAAKAGCAERQAPESDDDIPF